jgi:hypothetical protein
VDEFKLGKGDVGFKLGKDWSLEVAIPEFDDNENVPAYVLFVVALMVLIKQRDKEFFDFVWRKWDEYSNETEID